MFPPEDWTEHYSCGRQRPPKWCFEGAIFPGSEPSPGILVNKQGERFCDEASPAASTARKAKASAGRGALVRRQSTCPYSNTTSSPNPGIAAKEAGSTTSRSPRRPTDARARSTAGLRMIALHLPPNRWRTLVLQILRDLFGIRST
jgi:hypothetical protein